MLAQSSSSPMNFENVDSIPVLLGPVQAFHRRRRYCPLPASGKAIRKRKISNPMKRIPSTTCDAFRIASTIRIVIPLDMKSWPKSSDSILGPTHSRRRQRAEAGRRTRWGSHKESWKRSVQYCCRSKYPKKLQKTREQTRKSTRTASIALVVMS